MSDKKNEKEDKEFKVTDKRRFKADGESSQAESPKPDAPPEESKAPPAPSAEDGSDSPKESAPASEAPKTPPSGADAGPPQKVTFLSLIFSLATSAMMYMGEVADMEGKSLKDIGSAKQTIDLLGILSEKTKGNLTPEEEQFLSATLRDLRLRYVQVKK